MMLLTFNQALVAAAAAGWEVESSGGIDGWMDGGAEGGSQALLS